MKKLKGIKILRNKSGNATHLVINIEKHYEIVENIIDVLEAESRLNEPGKPAEEVYATIEAKMRKKRSKMLYQKVYSADEKHAFAYSFQTWIRK
jgi:hypothetical protein